jgi:CRP-like cAMP-binding protein
MTIATNEVAANRILALLPTSEAKVILPHMELTKVQLGDIIDQPGKPINDLYFPLRAAISITDILDERHTVEVTISGPEGCSGASIVQGSDQAVCMALVQIGGPAVRLAASALMSELPRLPYLEAALQRYNTLLLRHAVVSVGCNRFHSHRQRLARWLKAHWDRTGLETFPFTTEFLAAQVGLDRDTVTEIIEELKQRKIILKTHRTVTITDHDGLTAACCECFALCKEATGQYVEALQVLAQEHRRAE